MDGSLVRMPEGATRNKIKNEENFAGTRENNLEWKDVLITVSLAKTLFWLKLPAYSL